MVYRDFLIMTRLRWKIADTFYLPITTILIYGMFSIYSRSFAVEAGLLLLVANIYWAFALLSQSTTNHSMMEDVWSGSLKQLFFSGVTEFEYLFSRIISTAIVSAFVMALMLTLSIFFGFALTLSNIPIFIWFAVITFVASIALAIFVASFIFVMGREYGFLSWASMQMFVLLSAPFFPVETFPPVLQQVSQLMPFTNIFTGIRLFIETGAVQSSFLVNGTIIAFAYLAISLPLYKLAFKRAKKTGQLVRMS